MDAFQQQLLDANKARKVFTNTRDRLKNMRRKTNEDYIKILIDEINDYFACLESSSMCSTDLPTEQQGPSSKKHNTLLKNSIGDIDLIHGRKKVAQQMLTKAANFMSEERLAVGETASKLQARLVSHKLRSSMNSRNLLTFSEFFNDSGLIDLKMSKNIRIDRARSALSLDAIAESKDNSKLIDPASIRVSVEFDTDQFDTSELPPELNSLYPLCNQKGQKEFVMGYGRSLSNEGITNKELNITNATDSDEQRKLPIQKASLREGFEIGETETGLETAGEYELVTNDFTEVLYADSGAGAKRPMLATAILKAIGDAGFDDPRISIHPSLILYDAETGTSFSGANLHDNGGTDLTKVRKFAVRFSLKNGATFAGNLSRVLLQFRNTMMMPQIDYIASTVTTADGEVLRPFVNPPDSIENSVKDARALMLSSVIKRPKDFKIVFSVNGTAGWTDVDYLGAFWKVPTQGTEIMGYASTDTASVSMVTSSSTKVYFVYHDMVRSDLSTDLVTMNKEVVEKVIGSFKQDL